MKRSTRYKYKFELLTIRFWSYIEDLSYHTDEDCWNWIGYKNPKGYGKIYFLEEKYTSNRIAYFILKDNCSSDLLIEPWKLVCHTCDNPSCINPSHLYLGSHKTNIKDCVARNRHIGFSNLVSDDIVNEIRRLKSEGVKQKDIAIKFNLSTAYVSQVINYKTRKNTYDTKPTRSAR